MLSQNEKQVKELIENNLLGNDREKARLFHVSVERKLEAVKIWFRNVETIIPDFISTITDTASTGIPTEINPPTNPESTIIRISAYIDAFFMSGKSTLDAFAHEIRTLYGLEGHSGNLYFEHALDLLSNHHSDTKLNLYLTSINIKNLSWYKSLGLYRKAVTHESIIPIKASMDLNFFTGEWQNPILKLPLDPTQQPLGYNSENFIDTGKEIMNKLNNLIIESYDKILEDINSRKTKILL